jgi:hypothetical protein
MLKILIPIDTSEESRYAIKHVIHRVWTGEALDIHLIHVQPRLSRYVAQFVARRCWPPTPRCPNATTWCLRAPRSPTVAARRS